MPIPEVNPPKVWKALFTMSTVDFDRTKPAIHLL